MMDGPELWAKLGTSMPTFGNEGLATFWGFMAAFAELVGGLFVGIGLFFGPASLLVAFTMAVATIHHLTEGDSLMDASHSFELFFVYTGLALIGPGRYSVDAALGKQRR
jgi:putative oxidoreductase